MTFCQWLPRSWKKNWSGFNQPKLRDLGPLSDKKLETGNNKLWLVESSQKIYGGNGWGMLGDAGGFPPFMATSFAHQSLAPLHLGVPSISIKLEGLGKVPGAAENRGKKKTHFWGFEYDMMWYDMIMWYIIQDIRYKYMCVYIYTILYMWCTVECDIMWIRYVSKWVPVNKSIF